MELNDSEIRNETVEEFQKSQAVRLVDVLVIAPIIVYAGVKYFKVMPKFLSLSLITIGVATAVYNGRNFMINKNNKNNNLITKK
ncbi:MAG: hypothetical protein IPJ01_11970 [Micavibrio sp.]|nr:hypothetical protein [Micavibrio sp.]